MVTAVMTTKWLILSVRSSDQSETSCALCNVDAKDVEESSARVV